MGSTIYWQSKSGGSHDEKTIVKENEYIVVFAKNKEITKFGRRKIHNPAYKLEDEYKSERGGYSLNKLDRMMRGEHYSDALNYPVSCPDGTEIWPGNSLHKTTDWNWRWSKTKLKWGLENGYIEIKKSSRGLWAVYSKQYEYVDHNGNKVDRDYPYRSLITSDQYNTTKGGSEIKNILDGNVFDYAKPIGLIKHLIRVAGVSENDIVLDFFAGSGTTSNSILKQNAEDGINRKFISIQLDEVCDKSSEAFKLGFKTIPDISKERIRRVGDKILESECNEEWHKDIGFRVLKVDTSNMSDIYYSPDQISQGNLDLLVNNIKEDRTDEDLLFQVLLDWGVDLTLPIRKETICNKTVFFVDDNTLVACFDANITEELIKELAGLDPLRAVFRDDGFASDAVKINAEQIFKQLAPGTEVKSI